MQASTPLVSPGFRTSVRLWVSPLRRDSSEGLPAALTRRRDLYSTTHFWMDVRESVRCLTVDTLRALDPVQMGVAGPLVGGGQP